MNALTQLGFTSAPLLRAIHSGDFTSMADLSEKAGRNKANTSRDLKILEDAGLIDRAEPTRPTLSATGLEQLAAVDRANTPIVLHGQIERDPLNPRRVFHEGPLQALAESIWDNGKRTVLQPLVIRPREGALIPFRLVAGERRHRAIEILINDGRWPADMPVPVSIRILSDEEAAVLALVENMQREDLSAVDEALTFEHLRTSLKWSNADIAKHIKRTPEYVQQRLRVLSLDPAIQERMRLPKTDENRIGFKEARKLFTVSKEPTRPKAPELSPKLALALLELAHKVEAAPLIVGAEPGFTVLTQRPTGGALATLNERKIVVLREWGGQVFAKIQLYTSGAVTFLEDVGFYGPKRDEVIWAARTAIMSAHRASEATRDGKYITPELNTELAAEEPSEDEIEGGDEAGEEVADADPIERAERFSPEVQKASLAAYVAEGNPNAIYGRVSGTTTIEGETWPAEPTEVLPTPWKEHPQAKISLTVSSRGRWFVATSSRAGGPSYGGQSSPPYVYTHDPLFQSRADALAYASWKIVRNLGEWGKKPFLVDWLNGLASADKLRNTYKASLGHPLSAEEIVKIEKAARKPTLTSKEVLLLAEVLVAAEHHPSAHFNFSAGPVRDIVWADFEKATRTCRYAPGEWVGGLIDAEAEGKPAGVYVGRHGLLRLHLDGHISMRDRLGDTRWLNGLRRDAGYSPDQIRSLQKAGRFAFAFLNGPQVEASSPATQQDSAAQRALNERMAEVRAELTSHAEANPVRDHAPRSASIFARDQPADAVASMIDRPGSALVTLASSVSGEVITFAVMTEDEGRSICSSLVESGLWLSVTIHDRAGKLLVAWG